MSQDLPIAECRLDLAGLREQRDRYRRLGVTIEQARRGQETLAVSFGPRLDEELLRETIEVERGCCEFFTLDYAPAERRLVIGVERPEQAPALDGLAFALGIGSSA